MGAAVAAEGMTPGLPYHCYRHIPGGIWVSAYSALQRATLAGITENKLGPARPWEIWVLLGAVLPGLGSARTGQSVEGTLVLQGSRLQIGWIK